MPGCSLWAHRVFLGKLLPNVAKLTSRLFGCLACAGVGALLVWGMPCLDAFLEDGPVPAPMAPLHFA